MLLSQQIEIQIINAEISYFLLLFQTQIDLTNRWSINVGSYVVPVGSTQFRPFPLDKKK